MTDDPRITTTLACPGCGRGVPNMAEYVRLVGLPCGCTVRLVMVEENDE